MNINTNLQIFYYFFNVAVVFDEFLSTEYESGFENDPPCQNFMKNEINCVKISFLVLTLQVFEIC